MSLERVHKGAKEKDTEGRRETERELQQIVEHLAKQLQ